MNFKEALEQFVSDNAVEIPSDVTIPSEKEFIIVQHDFDRVNYIPKNEDVSGRYPVNPDYVRRFYPKDTTTTDFSFDDYEDISLIGMAPPTHYDICRKEFFEFLTTEVVGSMVDEERISEVLNIAEDVKAGIDINEHGLNTLHTLGIVFV